MEKKLATIAYHHDTFHLTKDLDITQNACEGVVEKPLKNCEKPVFWPNFQEFLRLHKKTRNIFDALPCITSLVKFLYKSDLIWRCNP